MSTTPARPREVNPDCIRALALLFVLCTHFYTHCDLYNAGYTGPAAYLSMLARTALTPALALFLMLNGYFQRGKTLSARYYLGILRLLEMYLLCAVLNLLYDRFYLGQPMTLRAALGAIVNFTASEYSWYILLYGGLFLMIPFLNLAYRALPCRGHKRILIVSFFLLSALPFSALNSFVNLCAYWWQRLWPISFYLIGAYFGEYRPRFRAKNCALAYAAALLLFGSFNFAFYSEASPLFGRTSQAFLYAHESLQNAVLSPLLFLWISNIDMSRWPAACKKGLAGVARYAYGAFLFSSIIDSFVYGWLNVFVPEIGRRALFFPVALPLSYAAAVLLSALADRLVGAVDRLIRPGVYALVTRVYRLLAPDAADG